MKKEEPSTLDNWLSSVCVFCRGERQHRVLKEFEKTNEWDDIYVWHEWQIVQCGGCETVSFRHKSLCSEDIYPDGSSSPDIEHYPPLEERQKIEFEEVPHSIDRIYEETLRAYNKGMHFLCSAGIRSIVEGICADLGVTGGQAKNYKTGRPSRKTNLEGKVNGLYEGRHLTKTLSDALHNTRVLGNESLHELKLPKQEEMSLALDILEHVLASLYAIDSKAAKAKYLRQSRTFSPVDAMGVWDAAKTKASLSWTRNVRPRVDGYEIRYCSGNEYNSAQEVFVATTDSRTLLFETDHGLTVPNSFALYKIYTKVAGSDDKGSEVIRVERP